MRSINPNDIHILYWHNLSAEEKKAIHNPEDYPIISVIDGMPLPLKKTLDHELDYISSLDPKKYGESQISWINDFAYYLWEKNFDKDPKINIQKTNLFFEEFCKSSVPIDYRLYFTAKNSGLVDEEDMSSELGGFLSEIYEVTEGKFGLKSEGNLESIL